MKKSIIVVSACTVLLFFQLASQEPKIIALVPVRNEAIMISQCLKSLARYVDAIVVLDDCSTDNTVAIVESLAQECKVQKIIRKTTWHRDEPADRNALLAAGRALRGTHFLVIDADEMFTANCLNDDYLKKNILALQPGDSLALVWIQLWRSVDYYRFDSSVWTHNYKAIIFCDNRIASYHSDFIHTNRIPHHLHGRTFFMQGYEHGLLHFQFVHWRNLLVKQAWYRCLERIRNPAKSVTDINYIYGMSKDERGLGVRPVSEAWFNGYLFFDRSIFDQPERWREQQVYDWFAHYGADYFKDLDIWDIDWHSHESLRKESARAIV